MKRVFLLSALTLTLMTIGVADSRQQTAGSDKGSTKATGEELFQTHCMRCHKPPEDLSPRSVKAVLRHMRVRANLSRADEKAILDYISPR